MILLFLILLVAAICSYGFYYTGLSLWFYFLWVPVSLILAILTFVMIVALMFQVWKKTDPKGKFRHHVLHQACALILIVLNVKVKVVGKENIPNETFVCYANHKSDLDPILIYYSLKRVCSAVGKKSLFKYPVIKQCQPVFGCISLDRDNDREAAKAIIECIRNIKQGMSYIIFPEGGIKSRDTEEMVNLRAGAYKLVTKSEALLLPVTIIGSSRLKNRKLLLRRIKVEIIIHKPITSEEYLPLTTQEIGQKVIDIINGDINN